MTDLTQAIADVKAQIDENLPYSMISDDPLRIAENTILNAVASGELVVRADIELGLSDPVAVHYSMAKGTIAKPSLAQICHVYTGELIPLADHKLAVAMVVEKAENLTREIVSLEAMCDHDCDNEDCVRCFHYPEILEQKKAARSALAPTDALAELQALRAELAATQAKLARMVEAAEALGAMPEGYCFCSQNRIGDESKTHEPECRDFRLLLQKIKG